MTAVSNTAGRAPLAVYLGKSMSIIVEHPIVTEQSKKSQIACYNHRIFVAKEAVIEQPPT